MLWPSELAYLYFDPDRALTAIAVISGDLLPEDNKCSTILSLLLLVKIAQPLLKFVLKQGKTICISIPVRLYLRLKQTNKICMHLL